MVVDASAIDHDTLNKLAMSVAGHTFDQDLDVTGSISVKKTSSQGYLRAYDTGGTDYAEIYHDGNNMFLRESTGAGVLYFQTGGSTRMSVTSDGRLITDTNSGATAYNIYQAGAGNLLEMGAGTQGAHTDKFIIDINGNITLVNDITASGALVVYGATTLGNGGDNVTVNCGTGTLSVNADRFGIDLDSTNADDEIDIARNNASPTNDLMTLTETHTSSAKYALRINHLGNTYACVLANALSSETLSVALCQGGANSTATAAAFYRNLPLASTNAAVVTMTGQHTGDDQPTLLVTTRGKPGTGGYIKGGIYTVATNDHVDSWAFCAEHTSEGETLNKVFLCQGGDTGRGVGVFWRYLPTANCGQAVVRIVNYHTACAYPVLELDQNDISEGFINFLGSDRGVITGATNSTKSIRVEINGVVGRLAFYADA